QRLESRACTWTGLRAAPLTHCGGPPDDQWGDMSEVPTTAAIAAGVESEDDRVQGGARGQSLAQSGLGAQLDPKMQGVAERVHRWLNVPVALVSLVGPDRQLF